LFEHGLFEVYEFENVPLDEDSYIIDEIYLEEYESAMLNRFSGGDYRNVGTIGWVIPQRRINNNSLELSWFPNPLDRYHIVTVSLPKDQIVKCVSCYEHSERPHLFVKSSWMNHLYLRHYSIFCLVDAIGFKKALNDNELTRVKLIALRDAIDKVAEMYSKVSFISFADNLLLKSNWTVGTYRDEIEGEIGIGLEWMELIGKKASRIKISKSANIQDTNKWNEYFDWMLNYTEKFYTVFNKHIKASSLL